MQHRADIQGLRAIAVLGVILFHAGTPCFQGGFLGVDVFFVISGFLITGLIVEKIENFRLVEFYERRARRILPALYLVTLACIPLAWYRLMPDALENFGQSLVAVVFMANNLLLFLTAGYWDLASDTKPLLHTWSLGVEEQFYLLFPLLLLAFMKYRRSWLIPSIAVLTALSFSFCLLDFPTNPNAVFYLPQYRAWELLAGSLAYFGRWKKPQNFEGLWRLLGIASIGVPFGLFSPPNSVASWSLTAVPIFGTCLLLVSEKPQWDWPVLCSRPMQLLGAASYSLYLLHQPAFAFTRAWLTTDPSYFLLLLVATACIPAAVVMHKFVEEPLRTDVRLKGLRLWTVVGTTSFALAGFGVFLHLNHGVPSRIFSAEQSAFDGQHIDYNMAIFNLPGAPKDLTADRLGGVLVIGNSYARDMANAFVEGGLVTKSRLLYREARPALCGKFGSSAFSEFRYPEMWMVVITDNVFTPSCLRNELRAFTAVGFRNIVYVGPKHFGRHLDAYSRVPQEARELVRASIPDEVARLNSEVAEKLDASHFVDALDVLTDGQKGIPIYSKRGLPLSKDGMHFSKEGAAFFAEKLVKNARYQWFVAELLTATGQQ